MTDVPPPVADLKQLGAAKYSRSEVVCRQGEPASALFYLEAGKVRVTMMSEQGKEAILAIAEPGDFVGEGCLTGQLRRTTAIAMTDCSPVRIKTAALVPLLHNDANFPSCSAASRQAQHANGGRSRRPTVQLERAAPRAPSFAASSIRTTRREAMIAKISQEELRRCRVRHFGVGFA